MAKLDIDRAIAAARTAVEAVVAAIYVAFTVVVVAQVFFRYALNDSLVWSEEFVRYAMMWSVLLGAGAVAARREHVNVDYLREKLGPVGRRRLDLLNVGLVLVFCGLMVWYGVAFALRAWYAVSPAGGYSMMVVYAAMPIGGALIAVFTLASLRHVETEERDPLRAAESEAL
jgi:TRAP-type C4-dicarboxylate transport system permease small subunit